MSEMVYVMVLGRGREGGPGEYAHREGERVLSVERLEVGEVYTASRQTVK